MAVAAEAQRDRVRPGWRFKLRQIAWAGLDLIYNPACAGCGRLGQRLCAACQAAITYLGPAVCAACGYPAETHSSADSPGCAVCGSRWHSVQPLAGLRSAAFFDGPLQAAIHQLKYKRDILLADTLAPALADAWAAYGLPRGVVVAVPLSAEREHDRGYNQAGLLARAFADLTGQPLARGALRRLRHTPSQVGLSIAARRANVRGAFGAEPQRVAERTVIVVDDVCTTGATLAAAGQALVTAGAAAVWGLTLGRARVALEAPARAR